jgi:hypothetical protein
MAYHHYVSAFHLAEFTPQRTRDGMLYVFDIARRRRWRSAANRAGGERGYNAVQDVPGVGTEEIEALLGRLYEGPAAPIIRRMNETGTLPEGLDDLTTLLRYIALLSANNRSRRGAMNDSQAQALRFMGLELAADSEFQETQAKLRSLDVPVLGEMDREALTQRLEEEAFGFEMSSTDHVRGLGIQVDFLAELLAERTWSVLIATEAPEFVIGDHPVSLEWKNENRSPFPPGFAAHETELLVPIGRRVALLGLYGGTPRCIRADPQVIGEANRRVVVRSRFVYSSLATYTFAAGGNICSSEGLFAET